MATLCPVTPNNISGLYRALLRRKFESFRRNKIDAVKSARILWRSTTSLLGRGRVPSPDDIDADQFHHHFWWEGRRCLTCYGCRRHFCWLTIAWSFIPPHPVRDRWWCHCCIVCALLDKLCPGSFTTAQLKAVVDLIVPSLAWHTLSTYLCHCRAVVFRGS